MPPASAATARRSASAVSPVLRRGRPSAGIVSALATRPPGRHHGVQVAVEAGQVGFGQPVEGGGRDDGVDLDAAQRVGPGRVAEVGPDDAHPLVVAE